MRQLKNFGDARQTTLCVHCGGPTETRDHAPSKVFLDPPYPDNLPVVPSCRTCNEALSLDEEYLACLIESTLAGTTDPAKIAREKVKSILERKPALAERIAQARHTNLLGETLFAPEVARVETVVLKLARGHALYELNEPHTEAPAFVGFAPTVALAAHDRERFEEPVAASVWPEVGSRAMQRMVEAPTGWLVVQPGLYRYMASVGAGVIVRMVIREYLACEAIWD